MLFQYAHERFLKEVSKFGGKESGMSKVSGEILRVPPTGCSPCFWKSRIVMDIGLESTKDNWSVVWITDVFTISSGFWRISRYWLVVSKFFGTVTLILFGRVTVRLSILLSSYDRAALCKYNPLKFEEFIVIYVFMRGSNDRIRKLPLYSMLFIKTFSYI